jgi:predicted TIM-barrel fold metal-dependent hydrolase
VINSGLLASGAFAIGFSSCDAKSAKEDSQGQALLSSRKVIDAHLHVTSETIDRCLRVMDDNFIAYGMNIGIGGDSFDNFAEAYKPHKDRLGMMYRFNWRNWLSDPDYVIKAPDLLEAAVAKGAHGVKIWKDLGLTVKDPDGNLVSINDERLYPIWERAEKLGCIVAFHTVDPVAFFEPWNDKNERWEELELHPDWSFADRSIYPARDEVLEQRNNVIRAFPNVTFQCVHVANYSENIKAVSDWLDEMPNMLLDLSARFGELGRHDPEEGRKFFTKHQDRIMFGTDRVFRSDGDVQGAGPKKIFTGEEDNKFYNSHWRYLETNDKQFDHPTPIQGNWKIDGINLSKEILQKIYWDNAYKLYGLNDFDVT